MPNRILKESICTSESIDRLTLAQEAFLYRLLVQCDDDGCIEDDPAILHARCYPLKPNTVTEAHIDSWLDALEAAYLIIRYIHNEKPYLQIVPGNVAVFQTED